MSAGNAGIIGPLRALMTYFQRQHSVFISEWAEVTLSRYWQLFFLVQLMKAWTLGFSKGTHQPTFVHLPDTRYMEHRLMYTLNSFTNEQTFIVSCYQGPR